MKLPLVSLRDLGPLEVVDPTVARAYVRAAAACSFLGLLLTVAKYGWWSAPASFASVLMCVGMTCAFVALDRIRTPRQQALGLLASLCAAALVLTTLAWLRRQGIFSAGMAMLPLLVCGAGVLLGMRAAIVVALLSLACVAGLAQHTPAAQLQGSDVVLSGPSRALSVTFHLVCATALAFVAGRVMRRLLERARGQEDHYKQAFLHSSLPLVVHRDGKVLFANDSAVRLFGYASTEAMKGLPTRNLFDPSQHHLLPERRARAMQLPPGQRLPLVDYQAVRADGGRFHVRAAAARVELSDGPALDTLFVELGTFSGTERALLRSDAMVSRLFQNSPVCVMVTDITSGRYLMVNPGYERLTGHAIAHVLGRTSLEMGIWDDPAQRDEFVRRVLDDGQVLDMPVIIRHRDGSPRSIRLSGTTFDFEGQRCLVSQAHDVTQMEAERRELAAILDNASVGIAFTVGDQFVRVNRRMEEMLGWDPGTLANRPTRSIWPSDAAHRRSAEQVNDMFNAGRTIDFVSELYRRDGSVLICHTRGVDLRPSASQADAGRGGRVWIVEDVTERHRIARELEVARDAAEAGSRAKSAFLANMSHEIRTPLHGVMGLAELAGRADIGVRQREAYLRQLVESARALTHVISEVLDLSKIEAGQMTLETRTFDLHELAESVCSLYFPDAQTRGIRLALNIEPGVPQWVEGDAVRVRQILVNFSSNAMKFTARGSVTLKLGMTGANVMLSVRDTGPGFDEWTRQRLFTPFTQADDSTTRRFGGTGLGLSICRELAQLMGGQVGVSSEPGRGSEFWATLPLPAVAPPPAQRGSTDMSASAQAALELLEGASVLVVEDNAVNMMIATAQLEAWGVHVLQAGDGIEALELLAREGAGVDLVLMDLQMPRMGGEQAVRRLRETWSAIRLPVIALTAAALVDEQERALQAGFNDFITKPIESARLRAAVLNWLRVSRREETTW